MSMTTVYQCQQCETVYPTAAEAEACSRTPLFSTGTKFAYDGCAANSLATVSNVMGLGCRQMVSLRHVPAWWSSMRYRWAGGKDGGVCATIRRHDAKGWGSPWWKPLTVEAAREAVVTIRKWIADRKKQIREYEKRLAVLEKWLAEQAPAEDIA